MSESRIPISDHVSAGAVTRKSKIRKLKLSELVLRLVAATASIVTLIVLVTDKQTKAITIPGLSGFSIKKTAKYNLSKAFVYLVCASGIAAGHAIFTSILAALARPTGGTKLAWFVFVLDQLVTYILLAAAAASTEVAYLGAHASPDASWLKICSIFNRFCNQLGVSLVASFVATVVFALLTTISGYHVFTKEMSFQNPQKG